MVNNMFLQPQEVEVFYILPTIRKYLVIYMKQQGLSQKEIAKKLFIRESTVSQYTHGKRASVIDFNEDIKEKIKEVSSKINTKQDLLTETQKLLRYIRETQFICEIHRQVDNVPEDCCTELTGCAHKQDLIKINQGKK